MAISQKLKRFLDESRVRYTAAKHPVVYTAQEIAAAQHIPGRQLAKSVLVKTDSGPALAVLSAIHLIDLKKLKALLRAKKLTIAKETDITSHFPDMEVGAMSPFGNLYGVPVAVDRGLGEAEEMAFNAGSHTDTIKLRYEDFARLVKPKVGVFSQPAEKPAARKGKGKKKRGSTPTRRHVNAARPTSRTKRRTKKPTKAKKRR